MSWAFRCRCLLQSSGLPPTSIESFRWDCLPSIDVNGNTSPDVAFGNPVTATDPDSGPTVTYSLSGTDAASFAIVESSGQLKAQVREDSSFPCLPEPRRRSEHALLAVVQ